MPRICMFLKSLFIDVSLTEILYFFPSATGMEGKISCCLNYLKYNWGSSLLGTRVESIILKFVGRSWWGEDERINGLLSYVANECSCRQDIVGGWCWRFVTYELRVGERDNCCCCLGFQCMKLDFLKFSQDKLF